MKAEMALLVDVEVPLRIAAGGESWLFPVANGGAGNRFAGGSVDNGAANRLHVPLALNRRDAATSCQTDYYQDDQVCQRFFHPQCLPSNVVYGL